MSLNPEKSSAPARELPEIGGHAARCFAIIDLGIQDQIFNGITKGTAPEVMLCFELTQFMHEYKKEEGPVPLTVFQNYTFYNTDRAKLPKVMQSWGRLPKPPESLKLKPYLGQYCDLSIIHSKNGKYANIKGNGLGVDPFRKGSEKPKPFYENIWFDLDEFSWEKFNKLPKYAQGIIKKSKQWTDIVTKNPEPKQSTQAADLGGVTIHEEGADPDTPAF